MSSRCAVARSETSACAAASTGFQSPATGAMHYEVLLAGEDAYEGLSALLVLSQDEWGHTFDVDGVIFPGELPEYPALGELSE